MTDLNPLALADLSINLRNDMDAPAAEWTAWEYIHMTPDGYVDGNRRLHILHYAKERRGGVVMVGSGASGVTDWTDAATPEEVLVRYLTDDMRP